MVVFYCDISALSVYTVYAGGEFRGEVSFSLKPATIT